MWVDAHCHLYEFDNTYIDSLFKQYGDLLVFAVSDDYESSLRTIELAKKNKHVVPCIGLHPWEVGKKKDPVREAEKIAELAVREGVRCFGEIGLDTKFVAETIDVQRRVFQVFLEYGRRNRMFLNIHAAGTWEEVLELVKDYPAPVNIHWYTGPLHLITVIRDNGFFISINPAVKIQHKHREVVRYAPLDIILTESDGPYEYRGLRLEPKLIPNVVKEIASIKGVEEDAVREAVASNAERILKTIS